MRSISEDYCISGGVPMASVFRVHSAEHPFLSSTPPLAVMVPYSGQVAICQQYQQPIFFSIDGIREVLADCERHRLSLTSGCT